MVTIGTANYSTHKHHISPPPHAVCVLVCPSHKMDRINTHYFPKQYKPTWLCNWAVLCLLWSGKWSFVCYYVNTAFQRLIWKNSEVIVRPVSMVVAVRCSCWQSCHLRVTLLRSTDWPTDRMSSYLLVYADSHLEGLDFEKGVLRLRGRRWWGFGGRTALWGASWCYSSTDIKGGVMAGRVARRCVLAGRHERERTITRTRSRWE
jgi:hypothetical protein